MLILTCHCTVHTDKGIEVLYGRVGAIRNNIALIDEGTPCICTLHTLFAPAELCHALVSAQENGLMGGNNTELLVAANILGGKALRVLDAVTAIGAGPFALQALKAIKRLSAGSITDAVIPDLEACAMCGIQQVIQLFVGPFTAAFVAGCVGIIIQHPSAARTQRTVAGDLISTIGQAVIISADPHAAVIEALGVFQQFLITGTAHDAQTDVHTHLQKFLLIQFFPGICPIVKASCIVNGRNADLKEAFLRQHCDFLDLLFGIGRNGLVKGILCLVGDDAQQRAIRFLHDFAAHRAGRIIRDTDDLKSFAVGPRAVAAATFQIDGSIGCHGIQLFLAGEIGTIGPLIVDPSATHDPFTGLNSLIGFGNHVQDFLFLFAYDVELQFQSAGTGNMEMRIGQAGQNYLPFQIHYRRFGRAVCQDFLICAYNRKAVIRNTEGSCSGKLLVYGVYFTVDISNIQLSHTLTFLLTCTKSDVKRWTFTLWLQI